MKWYDLALKSLPLVEMLLEATIPGASAVIPFVNAGIEEAQQLPSDASNLHKKALVYDATQAAAATGKVNLDPATVKAVTDAVFATIDGIHAVVKANQNPPATTAPSV